MENLETRKQKLNYLKNSKLLVIMLFLVVSFVLGGNFIRNVSPQSLPDPDMHLYNTIALSQGQLVAEKQKGQDVIYIPEKYELSPSLLNNALLVTILPKAFSNDGWIGKARILPNSSSKKRVPIRNQYFFVGWLPQAIGFFIGNMIKGTVVSTSILARLFNLIFYVAIISLALWILPRGRIMGALIAVNPYSIFLASSLSSDAFTIAFVSLFIAYTFHLLENREIMRKKELFWFVIMGFFLFLLKIAYVPFLLLIFIFPKWRLSLVKKLIYFFSTAIVGSALYLVWSHFFLNTSSAPWVNDALNRSAILKNPFKAFFSIIYNTLYNNYIFSLDQISGVNFWILLPIIVVVISGLVKLSFDIFVNNKKIDLRLYSIFIIAALGSISLTNAALLLTWTSVNTSGFLGILGFQARYYLPLLFVLLLPFMSNPKKNKYRKEFE